jgi:hypothetical protein
MDRVRTAWIVVFVVGVAIGRFVLPRSSAEAKPITVTRDVVREVEVENRHVLTEVLRCATQAVRDEPVGEGDLGEDSDVGEPGDPGDGLTEDERWESAIAELEDGLPVDHGAIQGQVRDAETGEPLAGVTVVVTAPELVGSQTAITDERGFYAISALPASMRYLTTFYYGDTTVERRDIVVGARKVTPVFQKLATSDRYDGPTIESTGQGITIDVEYTRNIPLGIEGFTDPNDDSVGVSFSGTTTLENTYYIDGVPVSDEPM